MRGTLRSLLPAVAEALTPPDREGTDWDALGASSDEIREFALSGLTRRLKIVGVPLDTCPYSGRRGREPSRPLCSALATVSTASTAMITALATHHWQMAWISNSSR